MLCLATFFLLAAVKAKVRGMSITQACMKGYLHYLMVCAGHLMSHSSALAAWRGKRSSSGKCICHEGVSGFDAYNHKEITLDVNPSICTLECIFSLLLSTILTRQSIMFMY